MEKNFQSKCGEHRESGKGSNSLLKRDPQTPFRSENFLLTLSLARTLHFMLPCRLDLEMFSTIKSTNLLILEELPISITLHMMIHRRFNSRDISHNLFRPFRICRRHQLCHINVLGVEFMNRLPCWWRDYFLVFRSWW